MGAAYSRYRLITNVTNPNAVIVLVDLDDRLLDGALQHIDDIYTKNPDIWTTYGNWVNQHGQQNANICYPEVLTADDTPRGMISKAVIKLRRAKAAFIDPFLPTALRDENRYIFYPDAVEETRSYRQFPGFLYTHLRTFRRFLFDAFEERDFQNSSGAWYQVGTDIPLIGILEQCEKKNIAHVARPMYRYTQQPRTNTRDEEARLRVHADLKERPVKNRSMA